MSCILELEAEASHAALVLVDGGLAVGGRVGGLGEQHALVALRLFVLAHAAGLLVWRQYFETEGSRAAGKVRESQSYLGLGGFQVCDGLVVLGAQGSYLGGQLGWRVLMENIRVAYALIQLVMPLRRRICVASV